MGEDLERNNLTSMSLLAILTLVSELAYASSLLI